MLLFKIHLTHLLWKVSGVSAFFTCAGRPFHNRHPEYLKLFLKYSVLGLGGTKQPAVDDLRLTFASKTLFLREKMFRNIMLGQIVVNLKYKFRFSEIEPIINRHYLQSFHALINVIHIIIKNYPSCSRACKKCPSCWQHLTDSSRHDVI